MAAALDQNPVEASNSGACTWTRGQGGTVVSSRMRAVHVGRRNCDEWCRRISYRSGERDSVGVQGIAGG
jgi:hypothetical protein